MAIRIWKSKANLVTHRQIAETEYTAWQTAVTGIIYWHWLSLTLDTQGRAQVGGGRVLVLFYPKKYTRYRVQLIYLFFFS